MGNGEIIEKEKKVEEGEEEIKIRRRTSREEVKRRSERDLVLNVHLN